MLREAEGWTPEGKEKLILTEQRTYDKSGASSPFFVPFLQNLSFAFQEYAYMNYADLKFASDDPRVKKLVKAKKVRNRITHPKSAEQLVIADHELQQLLEVEEWYTSTLKRLFRISNLTLYQHLLAFERTIILTFPRIGLFEEMD